MKQGRSLLALGLAVALTVAALAPAAHAAKSSGADKVVPAATSAKKKYSFRQFTGYVTSVSKENITVEKRGKTPQTKTFSKHEKMKVTGEVEKDAHVTVYYRDENGRAIAHRVVVKDAEVASR